ncbi:hypothetical protein F2P45_13675 [Massilia sp. CCM 8733]|uniref:Uncharacterized protein n=1 Tax=Massilia mucilaginosa TaxID=2609282 RepID=A0ABX0NTG4_9BURK|nr:hypothetical protein [Massilia mucilaginosa]NHZ90056.1 hypothetical protein [Massilia mucilaginosa]
MLNKIVSRRTLLAGAALWLLGTSATMAQSDKVLDVYIFNYSDRTLLDVSVNGVRMGSPGPYPYSGRRNKVGARLNDGAQTVTWRVGGSEGQEAGPIMRSSNTPTMGEIPSDARYLSIHIYPDSTVEFNFSRRVPVLSKRGEAIDADYRRRKAAQAEAS